MSLRFVEAAEADRVQMDEVWAWVYKGSLAEVSASPPVSFERQFCVKDGEDIVSVCSMLEYPTARGSATFKCGGIAGVGTLAHRRGSGAGSLLMNEVIREMHRAGFQVSALYPYRDPYYRRFGYESCGWRWQIKCPVARFPKTELSLPVRRIEAADVAVLDQAYVPMVRGISGSCLRTAAHWEDRLGQKHGAIYAVGDPVEGYAWLNVSGFWTDMSVGEVGWSTRRGYESIMNVIAGLAVNQSNVVWNEPPNSPCLAGYLDQGFEAARSRPTMFRVIDVPGALRELVSSGEGAGKGRFSIFVRDEIIEENQGPWLVDLDNLSVSKCDFVDIEMDIRAFSQAVMGAPSFRDLMQFDSSGVHNPETVAFAETFFGSRAVVCMEFF